MSERGKWQRPAPMVRFMRLTRREGTHLLWTGKKNDRGYGIFWADNDHRQVRAHRWYWEQINGPIPDGLEPDHTCRIHNCVELTHLELVTHHVNTLRGGVHRRKEKCQNGHPLTGPEADLYVYTYTHPRGHTVEMRQCRTCKIRPGKEVKP